MTGQTDGTSVCEGCVGEIKLSDRNESIPTERIAWVAWRLAEGQSLRSAEVASYWCIHRTTANRMMQKMSRVLPIHNVDGEWQRVSFVER